MAELACSMHCVLETSWPQERLVELFRARGWEVRKWSWTDYEIRCAWAELYLEGDPAFLLHGPIDDPLSHADELFAPLRLAGIEYWGEFYGPDRELLHEYRG